MIFTIGILFLLFFVAIGIPIGFPLGIAGVASLAMLVPTDSILALMSKVAKDLLLSCNRLLRNVRGGMAMAVILAGTLHAAVTGSSTASAASLSGLVPGDEGRGL